MDDFQKTKVMFAPGAIICREGEVGDCAYIVESGSVEISNTRSGRPVVMANLGPGEIFGEMALIDDHLRSATATATDFTEVVVLGRNYIRGKLSEADPLLSFLLRVVLERFRQAQARLYQELRERERGGSADEKAPNAALEQTRVRAIDRVKSENELKRALRRDEFELYYQPIVRLSSMAIAGFEALLRWRHPERGLLAPGEFTGLAEDSDLIVPIDFWVFQEASNTLAELQRAHRDSGADAPPLFMGINTSSRVFKNMDLVATLNRVLQTSAVDAAGIKLEVTESVLMEDPDLASVVLNEIKDLGVSLAIDDFGTGYSSLSYLHRFPFDTLKIDRSFISAMLRDSKIHEIVNATTELGRRLGMSIVAEGVSSKEELAPLREFGCDYVQGYLVSKPVPRGQLDTLFEQDFAATVRAATGPA